MKFRITQYRDKIGNEKWKVERWFLGFWFRIQRPLELAHGMTDPFSREEALDLIRKESHVEEIISQEIVKA